MNEKIPTHIGLIIDGNRRWAKKNNLSSLEGHKKGLDNIIKMAEYIVKRGIKYISIFAFSTENFKRTEEEVSYLMKLFIKGFNEHFESIHKNNIKVVFSGRQDKLPKDVLNAMESLKEKTKDNTNGTVNICINYGGHAEIVDATKKIVEDISNNNLDINNLNEEIFAKYLYQELPPIDLLIRTGNEQRISNFMLWQLSYAELYFPEVTWPEFDEENFEMALDSFNKRDRRFGGNSNETKSN